jgi:hypothetical protein
MQTMREKWTDERLDDLKDQVVEGFRRTDERFVHLDRTMSQWFIALVTIQATMLLGMIAGFVTILTRI